MLSKIWTYGITCILILVVLISSCTNPFQFAESFHDCVHSIGSIFSDDHSHAHSHDFLDLLENKQQDDGEQDTFVLDKNSAKIINEIYFLTIEYNESNFHSIPSRIIDMLDAYFPIELNRPPIV